MLIHDVFKKEIDRPINGVIKVAQEDERSIKQELEEYVITRELRRHFTTFLNNYEHSIDYPTDKIGVWISGFFGSGKSHFLKILSYLLSNKMVAGKSSVSYFEDKFDDPMMFAQLERCASVHTDAILFNIDSKSPINKDSTAILRVFAKVFYEHQGFYGNDLKVAKLEQFISKQGKMDAFKQAFENTNGDSWENARDAFAFWEDDIVAVLENVLGMSETAARNWFNGTETAELTIEQLVSEIREYVNAQGPDYRLLFMIDEVGQYIGSDGSLMLNLQTIVEEIGSKCEGRVWVMVTSQEAIDSITKISGDDFSKIQGRFNTRLSLSSSSVDEVIKRRILEKTDLAEQMLRLRYEKDSAVLRNLFSFDRNAAVSDLKGYADEYEFVETYPFVPYQFRLMQSVLAQIRKHGNSGKHLSGGERSMLSGFQEAAQAIEKKDDNALVPFSLFYNTVHTFLDSTIRRVIDRCQTAADNRDGIEPYDVEILKLLYLIRYSENEVKANLDNITTLMVEDIGADKINMRKTVQASLDRLYRENYITRNGDFYVFLTDDEQDIAREIRKTNVNSAEITQKIADIIFAELYAVKKYSLDKYVFPFDQIVDETVIGNLTGAIKLRMLTSASDLHDSGDNAITFKSKDNEAIFLLSDEYPYFDEIENAMKIRKYIKGKNVPQLPEAIQAIIRGRQQQAVAYEKRARELIGNAILNSRVFVQGEKLELKSGSIKDKIEGALRYLVESVYFKLPQIRQNYTDDRDILNLLKPDRQIGLEGTRSPNAEAMDEVVQYLDLQELKHLPTSMGDIQRRFSGIPYGWREIDIAAVVAELIADQKVVIQYIGSTIQPSDPRLPDYLRRRTEVDKAVVAKRHEINPALMDKSRKFLREYFNLMDVPADEDGLIAFVIDRFTKQRDELNILLQQYSANQYPDKTTVQNGIKTLDSLLAQRKDNTALLTKLVAMQDELLDLNEDVAEVQAFFKTQRTIFDSAGKMINRMERERDYLEPEREMRQELNEIKAILQMPKPYRRISELPTRMQNVQANYNKLLDIKRKDVLAEVQSAMAEVHEAARIDQKEILTRADNALAAKRDSVPRTDDLTALDAMRIQIQNIKQQYLKLLIVPADPKIDVVTVNRGSLCYSTKLKNEADIDLYVEALKDKLTGMLEGHDVLQII